MYILADHSQSCVRRERHLPHSTLEVLICILYVSHCHKGVSFLFRGNTLRHKIWSRVLLDKLTESYTYIDRFINIKMIDLVLLYISVRVNLCTNSFFCSFCSHSQSSLLRSRKVIYHFHMTPPPSPNPKPNSSILFLQH